MTAPTEQERVRVLLPVLRAELTEHWGDSFTSEAHDEDILLTGCRTAGYFKPEEAAHLLAEGAVRGLMTSDPLTAYAAQLEADRLALVKGISAATATMDAGDVISLQAIANALDYVVAKHGGGS